ncbi:MAG TPA: hypothetical protein VGL03_06835 [Thermoanaerobaculia bacterium]|jgi:hypothetical protein
METPNGERIVPCRAHFEDFGGGVWRIEIVLSPGRLAFISIRDELAGLNGSPVECRVSETKQDATLWAKFLDRQGRVLFERKIYAPGASLSGTQLRPAGATGS